MSETPKTSKQPMIGQRFEYQPSRCPHPGFYDDGTNLRRVETTQSRDERLAYERKHGKMRDEYGT